MTVNFHKDTNSFCIVSFFFQNLSRMINLIPHQTPHTNKNCYYNPQLCEQNLKNNILGVIAN